MKKITYYYQQGYGGIEWILVAGFLGILAYFFVYPLSFHKKISDSSESSQFCRPYLNEDGSIKDNAPEIMVPTYDASTVRRGQPFPKLNPNDIQPFRLIKGNVPLKSSDLNKNYSPTYLTTKTPNEIHCETYTFNGDTHSHFCQWIHEPLKIDNKKLVVMYPAPYSDGNTTDRFIGASDPYDSEVGNDQVVRYGNYHLLFLLHIDEQNNPVVLTKATYEGNADFPFVGFDVYQQVKADDHSKPVETVPESVLKCIDKPYDGNTEIQLGKVIENSPDKKQEQLGWFVPSQIVAGDAWYEPACKPAINLYPPKDTLVNVKVNIPHGFLTYTDPVYPKDSGWFVLAHPNGDLHYLNPNLANSKGVVNYPTGVFPYLYYEGKIQDEHITKPETGFVRSYQELPTFFDALLPKLGLNAKEAQEFKQYWLKTLPKANYYFIGIVPQDQLDTNESLIITPKQDTMIRVRLLFQQLDKPEIVQEPIIQTPTRSGFTVVDWGAYVKNDKNHPFTCVQ